MSQTLDDAEDSSTPQGRIDLLHKMLGKGRSFSGHERNCLYLNTGGADPAGGRSNHAPVRRFANVSAVTGFDFPDDARGMAVVDWDYDGDLDLWVSNRNAPRLRFLRNESRQTGHALSLRLAGNGTTTNRDAVGARVQVVTDPGSPLSQIKTLRAGEGFISQNSKWMHFGLGDASEIERVIVRWPGGEEEEFRDLVADRRYLLKQGSGQADDVTAAPRNLVISPEEQTTPKPSSSATLRLLVPLEMPSLLYETSDGKEQSLQSMVGKPLLVNLWATWCQPCVKELRETIELQSEIRAASVQVLALSVDGLSDDESNASTAAEHLKSINFPFSSGHATERLLDQLQAIHDLQTPIHFTLPLPSSFLLDAQGRLVTIYKGPISIKDVLTDAAHSDTSLSGRLQHAAAISGSVLEHREALNALKREASTQRSRLATWLRQNRFEAEATAQYGKIVDLWPEAASARLEFGIALMRQDRVKLAQEQFEKALEIQPKTFGALTNLGQILMKQERYAAAREHYENALKLSPGNVRMLNNLGTVSGELRDYRRALEYFTMATEAEPNDHGGYNNLGWLLATCPDAAYQDASRAVASAERACELSGWKDHSTLDTLATAYAAAGRFNSAVRWATQALTIAPAAAKPEIHRHLQLYKAGKPYQADTTE